MTAAITLAGVRKEYSGFALQDIDLELPVGQVMGLVGVNGAGKSTIFRILMGLIRPDGGHAVVCGHRMPEGQVSAKRVKALLLLSLARHPKLLLLDEPTTGLDPVARGEVLEAIAELLRDETRSVLFSSHNTRDVEQISDSIAFLHCGRLVAVEDKESFLERWRRILCHGEWRDEFASVPEMVSVRRNGSVIEMKVRDFHPGLTARLQRLGLAVNAVDRMDLEDIFVASITAGDRA
jgi:ABC-2 type transport system ATP-binding protein